MPRVGSEPTTLAFGRAKTVHALDCTASDGCYNQRIRINFKKLVISSITVRLLTSFTCFIILAFCYIVDVTILPLFIYLTLVQRLMRGVC
jgi:hypothetical protein